MSEANPWGWKPGDHAHQRDTSSAMYRCPVTDCWWNRQRETDARTQAERPSSHPASPRQEAPSSGEVLEQEERRG
jgi:hypothetical protein